ncbi:MAG: inositol monophosphatase family protein [Eubacteriales bacterium]|nr:inositol monophosphatase family protein [Eubacteriales bacterium]
MLMPKDEKWLESISQIVREAGRLILNLQTKAYAVLEKGAANYVTAIDLAVQSYILAELKQRTPDFAVMAEESDVNQTSFVRPTWILDPVDGTTNLMRDYRHSAISLALAEEGRVTLGIVFNPYSGELFLAKEQGGSFLNGERIQTSSVTRLADSLVGFGTTPYDRTLAHTTFQLVEQVFLRTLEVRRSGSAALDLAYIACGRLDGFFEMTLQPWDYAAGSLLIREAGGIITNWQGQDPSLRRGDSVLAASRAVHADLLGLIQTRDDKERT